MVINVLEAGGSNPNSRRDRGVAWEEPRPTQDLGLVVKIPIRSIHKLSKELEKKDMLEPAKIILDAVVEARADIQINAIHMHRGLKASLHQCEMGMNQDRVGFGGGSNGNSIMIDLYMERNAL